MPIYSIQLEDSIDPRTQPGDYLVSYRVQYISEDMLSTTAGGEFVQNGYQSPEYRVFGQNQNWSDQYDNAKTTMQGSTVNPTPSVNNNWNAITLLGPILSINFNHNILAVDISQALVDANDLSLSGLGDIMLSVVKNDFIERSGVKGHFMTAKLETNSTISKELFEVGANVVVNSR